MGEKRDAVFFQHPTVEHSPRIKQPLPLVLGGAQDVRLPAREEVVTVFLVTVQAAIPELFQAKLDGAEIPRILG